MSTAGALPSSLPRPSLRRLATAPVRLRTYGNLLYLALAFPLGLAYFVVLTVGLSLGVGLSVIVVGLGLLLATLVLVVALATVERYLAALLLGVDLDPLNWAVLADGDSGDSTDPSGPTERLKRLLLDRALWAGLVFLLSKLFVGVAAFTLVVSLLVPAAVLVATPFYYRTPGVRVGLFVPNGISRELSLYVPWNELLVGVSFVVRLTSWEVDTLPEALVASGLGVVAVVAVLNVFNAAGWLCAQWARLLLGPELPSSDRIRR
jgi:hypothetical protein